MSRACRRREDRNSWRRTSRARTARSRAGGAGGVRLAKANLHEWAVGVTTDNPHFGPTRNPWAPDRIPGGSSGGNGAAVIAGEIFGSIGTDNRGVTHAPRL